MGICLVIVDQTTQMMLSNLILKSLLKLFQLISPTNSFIVDAPAHPQQTVLLLKRLSLSSWPKTGTTSFSRLLLLDHDPVQDFSFAHGQVDPGEGGPAVALTLAEREPPEFPLMSFFELQFLVLQPPQLYFSVIGKDGHLLGQIGYHLVADLDRAHYKPYLVLIFSSDQGQYIPHETEHFIGLGLFDLLLIKTHDRQPKLNQHFPALNHKQSPYSVNYPFWQLL